ncbi:hypothetical protein BDV96DRAFT_116637 [Lophiotrema nucula]|uniref:DUF7730 domain-containing protein n=1 Tax=Lophiotrema nucula TaxID=690887 RepID=A0A6A5Z4B9_9PLEO|nr:hypothetical protein BDV96DRAFT_116637 [Lophiotrema nucula]
MRKSPGGIEVGAVLCCPCLCICSIRDAIQDAIREAWRERKQRRRTEKPPKECKTGQDLCAVMDIVPPTRHLPRPPQRRSYMQHGCALLRMPMEIRMLVYQELCGAKEEIFIGFSKGGLYGQGDPHVQNGGQSVSIVPLMSSCRQIYTDVINILYSEFTYSFPHTVAFLAFCGSVPARHFQRLRNIRLDFVQRDGNYESLRYYVHIPMDFDCLHRCGVRHWHNPGALELKAKTQSDVDTSCPRVRQKKKSRKEQVGSFWTRACVVMSRMNNLKNVHVDMTASQARNVDTVLKPLEILDKKGLNSLVVEIMPRTHALALKTDKWTRVVTVRDNSWMHKGVIKDDTGTATELIDWSRQAT